MDFTLNPINNDFSVLSAIHAQINKQVNRDTVTAAMFSGAVVAQKVVSAIYCGFVFTAAFSYYLGQAFGEGYYNVRIAAAQLAAEDLVMIMPDPELDEAIAEFKLPMLEVTILDCGGADLLDNLTVTELRKVCKQHQIKWRNAHGNGRNLTKEEMLTALS